MATRTQAVLVPGSGYADFCRMFWRDLDNDEDMLEIFKPTWKQKRFSIGQIRREKEYL